MGTDIQTWMRMGINLEIIGNELSDGVEKNGSTD